MSDTPSKYRLYRAALYLYPKKHRLEYGPLMAQTLDDMLAEKDSSHEKMSVWLRVIAELPFSIAQENVTNIGENGMNKLSKFSNKRLLIVFTSLLVFILVGTGFAARNRVVPAVVGVFYESKVADTLRSQTAALGNPAQALGLKVNTTGNHCGTMTTGLIRMQIGCFANVDAYNKLGMDDKRKQATITAVNTIETALKEQGYVAGSNGVTLTSLITGAYQGKDYSPDAFYQRVRNDYTCTFDASIAYSNPSPVAISMNQNCVRTINVFGKPKNATFDSTKGFSVDS